MHNARERREAGNSLETELDGTQGIDETAREYDTWKAPNRTSEEAERTTKSLVPQLLQFTFLG